MIEYVANKNEGMHMCMHIHKSDSMLRSLAYLTVPSTSLTFLATYIPTLPVYQPPSCQEQLHSHEVTSASVIH